MRAQEKRYKPKCATTKQEMINRNLDSLNYWISRHFYTIFSLFPNYLLTLLSITFIFYFYSHYNSELSWSVILVRFVITIQFLNTVIVSIFYPIPSLFICQANPFMFPKQSPLLKIFPDSCQMGAWVKKVKRLINKNW